MSNKKRTIQLETQEQYSLKIIEAVQSIFNEDSEYHIPLKELESGENWNHFFHALSNIVPAFFYNEVTGKPLNYLEWNHLANNLVFQYSNLVDNG